MLERRHQPGRLQTPDVRGADGPDQVRILADGLLGAAPARIDRDVQHGSQPLVEAGRSHARADRGGHPLHQRRIEGGAPGQRHGIDRGLPGGEAGQALVVSDGRDTEAARGHHVALQPGQPGHAVRRRERPRPERPGQLTQSVRDQLRPAAGRATQVVLVRGHHVFAALAVEPDAGQLGHLLGQGHPGQQVGHALGGRPPGVAPARQLLAVPGRVRAWRGRRDRVVRE